MRTFRFIAALALLCLAPGVGNSARAEFVLAFGQDNYLVAPGGTVAVDVFLVETGSNSVLADDGLLSGAIRVFFNQPPRVADPAQVSGIAANPDFDFDVTEIIAATPTTSGEALLIADALDPVFADPSTPDRILLGTFTFTVGSKAGDVTQLLVTVDDPILENFLRGPDPGFFIPNEAISAGTATITVIPEPSALTLMGIGLVMVRIRCRFRSTHSRDGKRGM